MLTNTIIANDHYLHLTVSGGKLKSEFQCMNHETCDAVKLITDEEENHQFSDYNVALEWFTGKDKVALMNGSIHLVTNDSFVEWSYLGDTVSYDACLEALRSKSTHPEVAFIGWVQANTGPGFDFVCVDTHYPEVEGKVETYPGTSLAEFSDKSSSFMECEAETIQGTLAGANPFEFFGEEDGTEFRNDYVNIGWVSHRDHFEDNWDEVLPHWSYTSDS